MERRFNAVNAVCSWDLGRAPVRIHIRPAFTLMVQWRGYIVFRFATGEGASRVTDVTAHT